MLTSFEILQAGRFAELDDLASKFISEAVDARNAVFEQATTIASSLGSTSQYYLKVMQKIIGGSEDYILKETARCVSGCSAPSVYSFSSPCGLRLSSILKKRTLNEAKLDELKIKTNILSAFVAQKAENISEDVKEAVEETIERVREEL